jgi:hypothetical protein
MNFTEIRRPALWMALLGVISGIISTYAPNYTEDIAVLDVPVLPGIIFGLVIAYGIFRWGKANWIGALLALVFIAITWVSAVRGFYGITDDGQSDLYAGAFVAGAIGAAGTMLGGALTVKTLRRPSSWILTILAGAIAGMLVVPLAQSSDTNFLLLFIVWQAAVAVCVGYALTNNANKSRD